MNKPKRKIKFSIHKGRLTFTVEGVKGRMCFGGGNSSDCEKCNGKYCPLYKKGKCACDDEIIRHTTPCRDIKKAAEKLTGDEVLACPRRYVEGM